MRGWHVSFLVRSLSAVVDWVWKTIQHYILFLIFDSLVDCVRVNCLESVIFLLFANIIGSTVLRCLVNSVSFIRLLGVSLVVMEWQTFTGSRHLAKYGVDSSSECSLAILS